MKKWTTTPFFPLYFPLFYQCSWCEASSQDTNQDTKIFETCIFLQGWISENWYSVIIFHHTSFEKPSSSYCVMHYISSEAAGEIWNSDHSWESLEPWKGWHMVAVLWLIWKDILSDPWMHFLLHLCKFLSFFFFLCCLDTIYDEDEVLLALAEQVWFQICTYVILHITCTQVHV